MGRTMDGMVISESNHDLYGLMFDWWNQMSVEEAPTALENSVYYTLCACYSLVAAIAMVAIVWIFVGAPILMRRGEWRSGDCPRYITWKVQLVRIQMRVPEFGWTTQKVFHLMNVLVNGLRAILFGLYKLVFRIRPRALEIIFLDLPGLLFFSTYTLLVLFWAEIYHQARSLPTDRLRPIYYSVNGIVYFIQIIIWICMSVARGHVALEAAKLFFSVVSFVAAFGFLIYGGRLFFMLRRFPIESRGRQKKLYEVGCVTAICCTCFLVRCAVSGVAAFDDNVDVDVMDHPVANLLYYMVVEIIPSGLVLFILRKLPPKRVSDQYHAIQ